MWEDGGDGNIPASYPMISCGSVQEITFTRRPWLSKIRVLDLKLFYPVYGKTYRP